MTGMASAAEGSTRGSATFLDLVAVAIWMGCLPLAITLFLIGLVGLPSTWAFALLLALGTLAVIPLYEDSWLACNLSRFICRRAMRYFPIRILYEDKDALAASHPCVLGIEPHSILPIGMVAMSEHTGTIPLPKLRCGATDSIFYVPFLRHVWSWLGLVPASKKSLKALLRKGTTVGVVPGGVAECLYLSKGAETIFVTQRRGFVRLALEEKAAVVPVFIFGQTWVFNWWKPSGKAYNDLARRIKFAPLLFWGLMGTTLPLQKPMTIVIGKPIRPDPGTSLTEAQQVDAVLKTFIEELTKLFAKYKKQAGYPDLVLNVL